MNRPLRAVYAIVVGLSAVAGLLQFTGLSTAAQDVEKRSVQVPEKSLNSAESKKLASVMQTHQWSWLSADFLTEIETRQEVLLGPKLELHGRVVDSDSRLVPDALVLLRCADVASSWFASGTLVNSVPEVFAATWTDVHGEYHFTNQTVPDFWGDAYELGACHWDTIVLSRGNAIYCRHHRGIPHFAMTERVRVEPATMITGRLLGTDSQGVLAAISLAAIADPTSRINNRDVHYLRALFSELSHVFATMTDGSFQISGFPQEKLAHLVVRSQIGGSREHYQVLNVAPDERTIQSIPLGLVGLEGGLLNSAVVSGSDIHLEIDGEGSAVYHEKQRPRGPEKQIRGKVVNSQTGEGVGRVAVRWGRTRPGERFARGRCSLTREDGTFEIFAPKFDKWIWVSGNREGYELPFERLTTIPTEPTPALSIDQFLQEIPADSAQLVEFRIRPETPLRVICRDTAGKMVKAVVTAFPMSHSSFLHRNFPTDGLGVAQVVPPRAVGDWLVCAVTEEGLIGWEGLTWPLTKDELNLELGLGHRIRGQVQLDEKRIAGFPIEFEIPFMHKDRQFSIAMSPTVTDASGKFQVVVPSNVVSADLNSSTVKSRWGIRLANVPETISNPVEGGITELVPMSFFSDE